MKTLRGLIRVRLLPHDKTILSAAAEARGQNLSAFIRDAAMALALEDLGCRNREEATAMLKEKKL